MHFAILGSGGVGGYFGAKLAAAGHPVSFIARGAHLRAIQERGLLVWSPLGDLAIHADAHDDPSAIGPVEVVLVAVKTYHNAEALPALRPLVGESTIVLTLQNGVDSADEVAAVVGADAVLGGAAYVATSIRLPGLIEQTGTHRRIVFGEVFSPSARLSDRVQRLSEVFESADIQSEPHADARGPLWEKFIYLAPFAGLAGATRRTAGPIWREPELRQRFLTAVAEVEAVAAAQNVPLADGHHDRLVAYMDGLPADMRASLLIDLAGGRPIEVEALLGSVVRRGEAAGVATPVMREMYEALRPFSQGGGRRH